MEQITDKKYPVIDAVWIAAALLAAEKYDNNHNATRNDMYFKQSVIVDRAQLLADGKMDSARVNMWLNADNPQSSRNYLRADQQENPSSRRLSMLDEFSDKTYPTGLNDEDILEMNGKPYKISQLFDFVRNVYPEVMKKMQTTDIDYIGLLDYLKNNQEIPYSNPEATTDPAEKSRLLSIKQKGQEAVAELKKIANRCEILFGLDKCEPISWLDGSNTKTRKYLWAQMKYSDFSDNPMSVSLFVEKSNSEVRFRISLEIKDAGTKKDAMTKYHTHLDMPIEDGMVYVYGSNEWGTPADTNYTQNELKEKIKAGEIRKVQLCIYIDPSAEKTNEQYDSEVTEAVKRIIPYYEYVIGKNQHNNLIGDSQKMTNKNFDKNMILYGPPGTGKTFNTVIYAVAICEGESIEKIADEAKTNYLSVKKRYDDLMKAGRVAFTTFHQSYGYEEFIEGIKPDTKDENISYKKEDGVFKKFCLKAKLPTDNTINYSKVWHVMLGSTGMTPLKKLCLEEGSIRIGWSDLPNTVTEADTQELSSGASNSVLYFQNTMQVGDIVVTGSRLDTIDCVGIITGEYEFDDSVKEYPRKRTVKWIARNVSIDARALNDGKFLDRDSVFPQDRISGEKLLLQLPKYNCNGNNCVFIIDEINRGNISKIFGELITLIEDTKREGMKEQASAILPYSGDSFSVPSNVYILGTMNTADRSIALMDTALRRRFQFVEMMPDADVLRKIGADKVEDLDVSAMLKTINERITFLYDREHTIGHAFFTKLKDFPNIETLASIFEKSVIPLLQEYFYEDYQKIQLVLGDNGKTDPTTKFILDDEIKVKSIFKGNVDDAVDLPEKKYTINKSALTNIESYKQIIN